ncbi:MAG: radical SAM family heme chaperone HemW [Aquificaceae bacterium]
MQRESLALKMFEGIYIHIPFCEKKCPYCDFFSIESGDYKTYLELIAKEAKLYSHLQGKIKTMYFGGGTPSILKPCEVKSLIDALGEIFDLSNLEEITIECNPESYSIKDFEELSKTVNRVSFGIQTFSERGLKLLGRTHSPQRAKRAVMDAKNAGFENINIDIIYAYPEQTKEELLKDLEMALELEISHISAYLLTIYEDTLFELMVKRGDLKPFDEDRIEEFYILVDEFLTKSGFSHYEVCNFAKEGFECRHNLIYWQNRPFLGLGASAGGFIQGIRYLNVKNLRLYEELIRKGLRPVYSLEVLESREWLFDYVFCNLRTKMGIKRWFLPNLELPEDTYISRDGNFKLSLKGWLLINEVLKTLREEL